MADYLFKPKWYLRLLNKMGLYTFYWSKTQWNSRFWLKDGSRDW